jgi:hypothetical protein
LHLVGGGEHDGPSGPIRGFLSHSKGTKEQRQNNKPNHFVILKGFDFDLT